MCFWVQLTSTNSPLLSGILKSRLPPYFTAKPIIPKLLTLQAQFFDMIGSTGMTMLYPKESSQLPLVWAHGRAARRGGFPPSRRLCVTCPSFLNSNE